MDGRLDEVAPPVQDPEHLTRAAPAPIPKRVAA
jgi:hypothetical protein